MRSRLETAVSSTLRRRLSVETDDAVLGYLTLAPVFLLLGFVILLPVLWAVYNSFFSISTLNPAQEYIGLQNYQQLLTADPKFWASLGRAAYFAVGSTLVQLLVAIPTALLLNKKMTGMSVARAIALLPYLIPTIVVGLSFEWMMHPKLGVFTALLQWVGLIDQPIEFFGDAFWAMPALILANSWKFTSFMTIIFLARLQAIPNNHYEAAKMCGANSWEMFRDITLPHLRSVILLAVLLRGIFMFNKFDIIWILTEGGPNFATTTLPVYIYRIAFVDFKLGEALAASTLLFVILVIGGMLYLRAFDPTEEVET
jgi:multiple sugar transport system permease protein